MNFKGSFNSPENFRGSGRKGRQAMDYRDTLNLPKTDFPMKANLPKREPETLREWETKRIYDRLCRQANGRPK